ncbi:MAG: hypothetical protein WBE72_23830 [Terracidiphilus sp.]
MLLRLDRAHRIFPLILGVVALTSAGMLFIGDGFPGLLPAGSHDLLAAASLAATAFAYLVYQIMRRNLHRTGGMDLAKSAMLGAAFLFWAANQLWSNLRLGALFNDLAIAFFVLDIFLVIAGWPRTAPDASFAQTYADFRNEEHS